MVTTTLIQLVADRTDAPRDVSERRCCVFGASPPPVGVDGPFGFLSCGHWSLGTATNFNSSQIVLNSNLPLILLHQKYHQRNRLADWHFSGSDLLKSCLTGADSQQLLFSRSLSSGQAAVHSSRV
jgi:hypothetical protein